MREQTCERQLYRAFPINQTATRLVVDQFVVPFAKNPLSLSFRGGPA
jgi:hypothetical protein